MQTIQYFAFGSNLDLAQLRRRCPGAQPLARATLARHRLAFAGYSPRWDGGVATVVPDPVARVVGLLVRLPRAELAALDRAEGHPCWYARRAVRVWDAAGRRRRAQCYVL